jgi:hypothetical protein
MPRKITSGVVGAPILGSLSTKNSTFSSIEVNSNISLEPNGTGIIQTSSDIQLNNTNGVRFADADSSNYITLKSPGTVGSNVTLTLPDTAGANLQVLTTDGSGNLSWSSTGVSIADQTADTSSYNVVISTQSSGQVTTLNTSSTKISFVPSSGTLTATQLRASSSQASSSVSTGALVVTGGVGIGGTMTATSVVETSSITLKENIEPITNGLDRILQLKGVTYDRLDNNDHESGLIAEWTETVLPELVTRDLNGDVVGIKYTKLTAYLIEAIKSLKEQIDELKR